MLVSGGRAQCLLPRQPVWLLLHLYLGFENLHFFLLLLCLISSPLVVLLPISFFSTSHPFWFCSETVHLFLKAHKVSGSLSFIHRLYLYTHLKSMKFCWHLTEGLLQAEKKIMWLHLFSFFFETDFEAPQTHLEWGSPPRSILTSSFPFCFFVILRDQNVTKLVLFTGRIA